MSGFEIVGAIAAVEGLIKGTSTLYSFVHDVVKAKEEREQLETVLEGSGGLKSQLQLLKKRAEQADAADKDEAFLFEGLLQLQEERASDQEKKLLGDNIGGLRRMEESMIAMQKELKPGHGLSKLIKRSKWTKDKADAKRLLEEVNTWKGQVDWALNYDHQTATMATYALVKENFMDTKQVLVKSDDISEKLQKLELRSEEQRARDVKRDLEHETEKREKLYTDIATWLSPLDFGIRHNELLEVENRIDMSGELRKTNEFQAWISGKPWILYCWADAGAGKTILTSMIIDHLQTLFKEKDVPILYMYLNHKEQKAHTAVNLIGSLLKQLIMYKKPPTVTEELIRLYTSKAGKSKLSFGDQKKAFCQEIESHDRVIVIVDALDEASQNIQELWYELLGDLPLDRLNVLVTSRKEEAEVEKGIACDRCGRKPINIFYVCDDCPFYMCYPCREKGEICNNESHTLYDPIIPNEEVFLNVSPSNEAIEKYVENEIHRQVKAGHAVQSRRGLYKGSVGTTVLGRLCKEDTDLEQQVKNTIVIKANGKFLLAKLYVDSLKQKLTKADIKRALKNLPQGYADTYEQTMKRIQESNKNDDSRLQLAVSVISWVVQAHRELTIHELLHALATLPDSGFDADEMPDRETLVEVAAGLVIIANDIVRLPHYTAYEYFDGDGSKWFDFNVHAKIACVCLDYMNIEALRSPLPRDTEQEDFEQRKEQYPLLAYAYEYWGLHAREARLEEDTSHKVLELLRDERRVAVVVQAFWYVESAEASRWEIRKGATALHVAAWFGLSNVLPILVEEEGIDVDSKDPGLEQTPLIYAARQGHTDTVKNLLELGASINEVSAYGQTAMYEAFHGKHYKVAKILLERTDLDINYRFTWQNDRTILIQVATKQISPVLELILGAHDVDVNLADAFGDTALGLACAHGQALVVARLLEHTGIDVNAANGSGYTPLSLALWVRDHDESASIVGLLLEHKADPEGRDKEGGSTPAIRAADEGNLPVLEALHSHDAKLIHQLDDGERSVLHAAALGGHALLIQYAVQEGMNVDILDQKRRTPLHDAARVGSQETIKMLLSLGASSKPDSSGREPWKVAWQNGHLSVLHLLNAEIPEISDQAKIPFSPFLNTSNLPIWSLAKSGREELINKGIRTSPASINSADLDPDTGDTAVHCAIVSNNLSVLSLLLTTPMPTTIGNTVGRTPLHTAAMSANKEYIVTLLSHIPHTPSVLDARDRNNHTPLWLAYRYALPHSACLLVAVGATVEKKAMILPLFFNAIEYGYLDAVRILLESHNVPVSAKNNKGESAMVVARVNGWKDIEKELRRVKSRFVIIKDVNGEEEGNMWESGDSKVPFPQPEDVDEEEEEVIHQNIPTFLDNEDESSNVGQLTDRETRDERVLVAA